MTSFTDIFKTILTPKNTNQTASNIRLVGKGGMEPQKTN